MANTKSQDLRYPRSVDGTKAYLCFRAYDYASSQAEGWSKGIMSGLTGEQFRGNDLFPEDLSNFDPTKVFGSITTQQAQANGAQSASGNDPSSNSSIGQVKLYLPPKLEYSYGAEWKKVQFGGLGSLFNEGYLPMKQALKVGGASFANFLADTVTSGTAFQSIPKVSGVDMDSLFGGAFGIVFNDNTIQTFDKMSTRTFNYDYIMVARNPDEEKDIKKIIRFFKLAMHPTARSNNKNNTLFLGYPYVFRIIPSGYKASLKTRQNGQQVKNKWDIERQSISEFIPQTKYCGLTRFNVDYTPDNVIALTRGAFVQAVRISLSFAELETLTRQDIESFEDPTSFDDN